MVVKHFCGLVEYQISVSDEENQGSNYNNSRSGKDAIYFDEYYIRHWTKLACWEWTWVIFYSVSDMYIMAYI